MHDDEPVLREPLRGRTLPVAKVRRAGPTRAYSESMRVTLQEVNANGGAGLYDWYIGMHLAAEQFRREHPCLWALSKMGSMPGL